MRLDIDMWLFIVLTQLLAMVSSAMLWWLIRPKSAFSKIALIASVFIINNIALFYGLSGYWRERFHIYLVISILQGFMVYALLITGAIAFIYNKVLRQPYRPKLIRLLSLMVFIGIVSLALFNAYSPVVKRLTVTVDKPLDQPIEMILLSDTHIGQWFGSRQLDKLVNLVDKQNPDVVLIAGDVMNDTTYYYDKSNMHEQLSKLQAPLGVYAVLGNHDYSGNEVAIAKAVQRAGIEVIDNKTVLLDEAVWLVGRSDETDIGRPLAADLLAQVDSKKPVIVLEHSPSEIEFISELPFDLHLAGHTHGGQIFPLTYLLKWFTPLVHGHKRIDGSQFLVTSGYGFGAVPFRLGTRSEVWAITLESGL